MFKKYKKIDILNKNIENLNNSLKTLSVINKKSEIIKRNILAGMFRGVGIGIGVTIITAIIVVVLQRIVMLNLPIIGEYVTDIVNIVQKNMYR
ncbi:MAG: hypothetical protein IKF17_02955 [Clostridia bacterium]|nr:hypothetical protein [Clostridia bacterium]